jgi:hypothetical protein
VPSFKPDFRGQTRTAYFLLRNQLSAGTLRFIGTWPHQKLPLRRYADPKRPESRG